MDSKGPVRGRPVFSRRSSERETGRRSRTRARWLLLAILAVPLAGCAPRHPEDAGGAAPAWAGDVQVHGALRAIHHEGRTEAQVTLDQVLPNPGLYAVGALAGLAGEITIVGGRVYLAYPEGAEGTRTVAATRSDAGAALLITAEVPEWRAVVTERPIRFEQLDDEIGTLAAAVGLTLDRRFPFVLEGPFEDLRWHVVDGSRLTAGQASPDDHRAASVRGQLPRAAGRLVGFYSGRDEGVITHMGSKTHIHWVADDPPATGHVDHVVIPAGTRIEFPVGGSVRPR